MRETRTSPGAASDERSADVHGDASHVVVVEFDFAAVETCPDLQSECLDRVADRGGDRIARPGPSKVA